MKYGQFEEGYEESPVRSAQFGAGSGRQKHLAGLVGADEAPVCDDALFCTECRRHSWRGLFLRKLSTSARATLEACHIVGQGRQLGTCF